MHNVIPNWEASKKLLDKKEFSVLVRQKILKGPEERLVIGLVDTNGFSSQKSDSSYEPSCRDLKDLEKAIEKMLGKGGYFTHFRNKSYIFCTPYIGFDAEIFYQGIKSQQNGEFAAAIKIGLYDVRNSVAPLELITAYAALVVHFLRVKGKKACKWYRPGILYRNITKKEVKRIVETIAQEKQLYINLQPIVECSGEKKIVGAEALIRWNHPEYGPISPFYFLPMLEEARLTGPLDMFVLKEVCRIQKEWLESNKVVLPISVNLSRSDFFDDKDFASKLIEIVDQHEIDHSLVMFELTEKMFSPQGYILESLYDIKLQIQQLKDAGFKILIDDYGSGYSNIKALYVIPFDILKLDKSLVDNYEVPFLRHALKNLIGLMDDLSLQVIAEGIETKEQHEYLAASGCSHAQGFYYSKPLSVNDYQKLIGT